MAAFMLVVFVLSIAPIALAEETTDESVDPLEKMKEKRVRDNHIEKGLEQARGKLGVAKEKRVEFRERYAELKQKQADLKDKLIERREALVDLKNKVSDCSDEDCRVDAKKELKLGALHRVRVIIDVMDKSLDRLAERLDADTLSEEDKEALGIRIDTLKESLAALKEKVTDEMSAEELRGVVFELKELRHDINAVKKNVVKFF